MRLTQDNKPCCCYGFYFSSSSSSCRCSLQRRRRKLIGCIRRYMCAQRIHNLALAPHTVSNLVRTVDLTVHSERQFCTESTACHRSPNKNKLSRCWDSATCEPLDAILRAEFDGSFRTRFRALPVAAWAPADGIRSIRRMRFPTSVLQA